MNTWGHKKGNKWKSYLLMSREELKIGSFICQSQKAIAEVVGLRHMIDIVTFLWIRLFHLHRIRNKTWKHDNSKHFFRFNINYMLTCWSRVTMSSSSLWLLLEELSMPRRRAEGCIRSRYGLSSESWERHRTMRGTTLDYWRCSEEGGCLGYTLKHNTLISGSVGL